MSAGRPCGRSSKSRPGINCSEDELAGGGAETSTGSSISGFSSDGAWTVGGAAGWAGESDRGCSWATAHPAPASSKRVQISLRTGTLLPGFLDVLHTGAHSGPGAGGARQDSDV